LIALLLIWALTALTLTLRHEPWRDEADSWLVARDLPLSGVVPWTRAAGTPFLWYVVVMPLARGGMPYATQGILHLCIATAAMTVFVFRAPFTLTTKALFLFSFYPLYTYGVIARSYSLGILLTFVLAALHGRRDAHPLIYAAVVALLCNVNAHSVGIAAAAMLLFAIGLRRHWLALVIMAAGMAAAFAQLYTPGYLVPPNVVGPPWHGAFLHAAAHAFLPSFESGWTTLWAIALLAAIAIAIRKSIAALAMLVIAQGGLAAIFTYLWIAGYRHHGLVLILTVTALWIGADAAQRSRTAPVVAVMLNLSLALSIPLAIRFARDDLTKHYSGSKEMAAFILRNGMANAAITAHSPAHTEAVLAHLPHRTFWYAGLGEDGSYMKWDRAYRVAMSTPAARAAGKAASHFRDRQWLFLSSTPLPDSERWGLTLLYATHEPLIEQRDEGPLRNDERYWLYRSR
jgi:hypothetical protein